MEDWHVQGASGQQMRRQQGRPEQQKLSEEGHKESLQTSIKESHGTRTPVTDLLWNACYALDFQVQETNYATFKNNYSRLRCAKHRKSKIML